MKVRRQGGGVAECHPVIRESVLLVHRARRLNREKKFWDETSPSSFSFSELGAVPIRLDSGAVW